MVSTPYKDGMKTTDVHVGCHGKLVGTSGWGENSRWMMPGQAPTEMNQVLLLTENFGEEMLRK